MYGRRESLNKTLNGLGLEDVYRAIIERIKVQGGDKARLGMGALMWMCHAERPLSANELCHAQCSQPAGLTKAFSVTAGD